MNSVDKNRDGKIEWEEFLEVMTEWLGEDLKPEAVKRRKLTPEQVSDIHWVFLFFRVLVVLVERAWT